MKKLSLSLCTIFLSTLLFAQSAIGLPNTIITGMSTDRWLVVNPAFVQVIDGKFVESKSLRLCQANLYFQNFRFSLPANVTIKGIDVRITRKKKGANAVKDVTVALLRPINATEAAGKGPNLAKSEPWTETLATILYPFPDTATDMNNQVFHWTPADVNHMAFGLFVGTSSGSGKGAILLIDQVELTIKYLQGTTLSTQTNSITNLSTINLKQLGRKFQVMVKDEGRYLFTVRTTAGVIVQQTAINSGKRVLVPLDARLQGYYIITVEGNNQIKSQLTFIQ